MKAEQTALDDVLEGLKGICDECEHPTCLDRMKAAKKFLEAWKDAAVVEAQQKDVEKWKSFCGCPMCEFHTTAYHVGHKFESEVNTSPTDHTSVQCLCGNSWYTSELNYDKDWEREHPTNKSLTKPDMENGLGHWTKFLKCPSCGRCIFADGRYILPRSKLTHKEKGKE